MRRACSGEVVWFSIVPNNRMIADHCRRGGKAVILEPRRAGRPDRAACTGGAGCRWPTPTCCRRPSAARRCSTCRTRWRPPAPPTAPARTCTTSVAGCGRFTPSYYSAPGRMNMTEVKGVKVIVDYCHNAPAMVALGDFVDRFFDDAASLGASAADRRHRHRRRPARPGHDRPRVARRPSTSTGSSSGRTSGCAAGRRARPPELIVQGARQAQARGRQGAGRSRSCWTRSRPPGRRWSWANPGRPGGGLRRPGPGGVGRAAGARATGAGRRGGRVRRPLIAIGEFVRASPKSAAGG